MLVVEDDENKRTRILEFLAENWSSAEVRTAASLMSGVRAVKERAPDVVLLDMTLPNYDLKDGELSGGMHAFGGVEFLKQMKRLKYEGHVIVLTQFETFGQPPNVKDLPVLDREMKEAFAPMYTGAVYYHASLEDWTVQLMARLDELRKEAT